ncbi:MAG: MFS transporter [Planctomycetota bacterium]
MTAGQFVSLMGDAVFGGAVAWLAKSMTGRDDAVGLVVFAGTLPWLVLGPVAGAWVDRVDRRRAMVASDVVRAAILGVLWLAARDGGLGVPVLAGAAFLVAAASTPFVPARDALLPTLAEGRSLVRFNAVFQVGAQLAGLLGLWLGGLLLGTQPTTDAAERARVLDVLALDGLTFLVSAATLAALVMPPAAAPSAAAGPRGSLFREAARGVAAAVRDPLLLALLVLTALDNLAIMGPAIVGAAGFVHDDLGLAAGHFAWFEGAMASGYVVGAVLLARFGAGARKGPLILWGMVLDGLTYVPFLWVRDYRVALPLIFVHGLFIPWIVVGRTTLIQQHVPEARRGQVFALVNLTVQGMTAVSALVAGLVAQRHGAPTLFLVAGVFGTLCGVAGFVAAPALRRAR